MEYPHQLMLFPGFSGCPFWFHTAETTHTQQHTRCYIWFSQFLFRHGAYESVAKNFQRCKKILSACRPRLSSLRGFEEAEFSESTEHLPLTTQASLSSQKFWAIPKSVCARAYSYIVIYAFAQYTSINSQVFFEEEIAILKILMERDVTSYNILSSFIIL